MEWSPQQEAAIKSVRRWLRSPDSQVFYLAGYAGSGKTTLATELARGIRGRVLYGAFTGKAALVLQRKGCDGASTIHSMIYKPPKEDTWEPKFEIDPNSTVVGSKLIVIDECSMVGAELANDLMSFDVPILVLGDPAQLPPVKDAGFFTNRTPDVMLTEVHRQAAENPIIRMSMVIREGGRLERGAYGESKVIGREDLDPQEVLDVDQVLVGLNKTRKSYNRRMREMLGMDADGPVKGDRLVCLRNDREKKLLNGGLWEVQSIERRDEAGIRMMVTSDDHIEDTPTEVFVRNQFFTGGEENLTVDQLRGTQQFTYGYALTTHKSQGSQWDNVMVFDESFAFREDRAKWLYTAVTRAAERVTVVHS